jgi:uncharacterized protein (TIGR02145 family)
MKARILILILVSGIISGTLSQNIVDLTFTAENNSEYVKLDSIKVMNLVQDCDTMIYWPDTTLSLEINPGDLLLYAGYSTYSTVGVSEINDNKSSFEVHQNYPNPMGGRSEISMYIPHKGEVHIMISDLQGKVVLKTERLLDEGYHSFRFHQGEGRVYFFIVNWNGISRSIKMISTGQQDGGNCRLDYVGTQSGAAVQKNAWYVSDSIVRESGILDRPDENTMYAFQFATNIPCPGTPTVEYEGMIYNTIQIFSQCWLKENLNVGTMIYGALNQSKNGIIEKYCFYNIPYNCAKYGGLYQWDEMMQYDTNQGSRGICPPGWHVPTDEEWKVLQGAADTQHGIGDSEWFCAWSGWCGYDVGVNLKAIKGWGVNSNATDLVGFSGLPNGRRYNDGNFYSSGGHWWTSTNAKYSVDGRFYRVLPFWGDGLIGRFLSDATFGHGVRCLRD